MLGGRGFRNVVYVGGGPITKKTTKPSSDEFSNESNKIYTNCKGNKNMSKWVQVSLSDFLYKIGFQDKEIYIDDIGFCKIRNADIEVNNKSFSTFYVKKGSRYKRLSEEEDLKNFIDDFTKKRNVMLYSASSTIYRNVSASNISYKKVEYDNIRLILNGRIGINFNLPETREYGNRFYSLNPFKIGKKDENVFTELVDITGFKTGVSLHNSKVTHENKPLKVLYTNNDNESNMNYIQSIEKESFGCGNYTGIFDSSNDTSYIYVLLQAAGGGGGGADNYYKILNYASGGGGGAGGGAICFRILVDHKTYKYELSVGSGGNSGKNGDGGSAGSAGGDTRLTIKDLSDQIVAQVTVSGGAGGGGGNGQTVGAGGIHGRNTIYLDNEGILTKICIVDGGDGGSGGNAGKSVATSGIWKETITTSLFDSEFSASQEFGTPGELVGVDDKGGSGGASWLGNGGYYFLDDIVVGF